jgi:hypothetical protein
MKENEITNAAARLLRAVWITGGDKSLDLTVVVHPSTLERWEEAGLYIGVGARRRNIEVRVLPDKRAPHGWLWLFKDRQLAYEIDTGYRPGPEWGAA